MIVNKKIGVRRVEFSPEGYKRAKKKFEDGSYTDLINMMKESLTDSHINGCLIGRNAGYMRDFYLQPYSDSTEDAERAEIIKDMIGKLDTRKLFKAIIEARLFVYKVIDLDYTVQNGLSIIRGFKAWDQKYFIFDEEADELKIDFGKEKKPIPGSALVIQLDEGEMPVMLPVLRDFILKEFGLESWASFLETFGEPFLLGKYPPGATPEMKKELDDALDSIARSSRGRMPDGTNIDIKETTRNSGDHAKFEERCDKGISIAILGHKNSVEDSSAQIGENLGPYKAKQEISVDDRFFIDANMQQIINRMYRRNWADGRIPTFKMDKTEPQTIQDLRESLRIGYEHGLKMNPDDYRRIGLTVYEDQKPVTRQINDFTYPD